MKTETHTGMQATVWLCRLFTGVVFVVSGWAKAVDPAGFIIKVGEYLTAWGISVPHEAIVAGCIALSALEFTTGAMLATGCLKRAAVWCATALMAFMLPLTLYIAIANPVADCGCFGDLFKISNWGTFAKNVAISAALAFLLLRNRRAKGLYPAPIQWLAATATLLLPLFLSFVGYHIQPVADFRPYRLGTIIFHPWNDADASEAQAEFIYERDGQQRIFTLDNLPDSTWTYVEALEKEQPDDAYIAVRDDDGEDVSSDIVSDTDPQAWLVVPDPGLTFLSRSHLVDELHSRLQASGIDFTAIVGNRGAGYRAWMDLTRPTFDVYSAEDKALEQLVRGNASLIYTRGGRIVWKRTLASLPDQITQMDGLQALESIKPVDNGRLAIGSAALYVAIMTVLYLIGLSPKLLRLITAKKVRTQNADTQRFEKEV